MSSGNGRLSLASDIQSVARLDGSRPKMLEAPAATLVAVPVCEAGTRGLTALTALTNEGADMAERTRLPSRSDSRTPDTAVKITPATGPVTATPTVA